ncbi:MAG: CPBP family intramembrane metalloprotease [Oscillospiraceae bacterium]|nr:CPBP family intramembrane metalloprotease [Oscillospiraceae bacterium]
MSRKKELISLIIGYAGAMLGLYGVVSFNQFVLMSLPLGIRLVVMIPIYWLIALIPIIVMAVNKDKPADYGLKKENIGKQAVIGLAIGAAMSVVLTLMPHLLGFGEYFSSDKNYRFLWQFAYEFIYCISAVGIVEELVFRGFIYKKIERISGMTWAAVLGSSVLFGAFHIFGGNIYQMLMTAGIGAFLCFCRLKIKDCSLLSLVIAHGVYDALITVWTMVMAG